nr:probable serine/threonine-protein kinase PBL17 isoform X1 [Populus alba]
MEGAQRVLVIQDASGEVSSSAIKWALHGLSLKPGDMLTLLGVLHLVNIPLGYRSRIDSSMFGVNQNIVDMEVAGKKIEYENHGELKELSQLYETHKVELKIEVATGPSPKEVGLKIAQDLKATWIILDRTMKKDRKYFLQKLSCGISRMKRNNSIEQLRGPEDSTEANQNERVRNICLSYDEMIPGSLEHQELFSIELLHPRQTEVIQPSQVEALTQSSGGDEVVVEEWQPEVTFKNSICNLCKIRRPHSGWIRHFTFEELQAATDGFSAKNTIYEGGIATACRGKLSNNLKIVVKQHKSSSHQGEMNFKSAVRLLKKARHDNVLMLLGSCTEPSVRLLVYEYACNGSVNHHISKHCPLPLTWTERMKVAMGAARGLDYLHKNNIIHGNMRTSNIALNHDFEPMLGDFGISTENPSDDIDFENGYVAPEYQENRKLSTRTDVYAFGVVLLELITGRNASDKKPGEKGLVKWARPFLKDKRLLEILDPRIDSSFDSEQLYWIGLVTQKCLCNDPKKRLTLDKVASALECITERKPCQVIQDLAAAKSYFYSTFEFNGFRRYDKSFKRDSFSVEIDDESRASSSFSFNSASFSRSPTSSVKSDKMWREKSGSRISYSEMLD